MKMTFALKTISRRMLAAAVACLTWATAAHAVTLAPAGTPLNIPHNYGWTRMTTIGVSSGEYVPFMAYQINTMGKPAGNYTITMTTVGFAGAINTYQNMFDPNVPNANFWDNGVVANSAGVISQTVNLSANSLFEIVLSAKTQGTGGTYSATITGPGNVNVTLTPTVQIRVGPQNKTIASGATTSVRVYCLGPLPHSYQWYGGTSGNTNVPIPGATNAAYFTPPLINNTSYWVRVTGPAGAGTANSGTATITVTGNPNANYAGSLNVGGCTMANGHYYAVQRFQIQQQGNYVFNCTAGFALNTYQGVFDPVHPQANLWGVTNGFYAAGTYDLVISKSGAGAFSGSIGGGPAIVNLLSPLPPMFLSNPQDTTILTGTTATLSVSTTCGTPFTLQWYEGVSGDTSKPLAGKTGFTFTTPTLVAEKKYWVRMTYAGGTIDSGTATVYITSGPIFASGTFTECDRRMPGEPGQPNTNHFYKTFVFTCSQDGTYNFDVNGAYMVSLYQGIFMPDSPNVNLYGVDDGMHTLVSGPNKYYLVLRKGSPGPWDVTVTGPSPVTVVPAPVITTPPTNANVFLNQTKTLHVGSPTAGVSYQWYVGSDCGNKFPIPGANASSYTTPPVTDYTNYCVELTTQGGYVFSPMVTVRVMPQAINDATTIDEDTTKNVQPAGILANDLKAFSRTLCVVNVQIPTNGSITVTTNGGYFYIPYNNVNGGDSFKYQVTDGTLTSAVATVGITINPVNDTPWAGWDYRSTPFQTPLVLSTANLMQNDVDPEGEALTLTSVSPSSFLGGTVTLNNNIVTYDPGQNFGQDNFDYTVKDASGAICVSKVFVSIPVQTNFAKLRIASLTSTNCDLQLLGKVNSGYWIKWAPTPTGPWDLLGGVMTGPYGYAEAVDPTGNQAPARFYRAVSMDVE